MEIIGGILIMIGGGLLTHKSLQLLEVSVPPALAAELELAFPVEASVPSDMAELLAQLN